MGSKQVTVWVHDGNFSKDEVVVAPDVFGPGNLPMNALVEIVELKPSSDPQDPRQSDRNHDESGGEFSHSASERDDLPELRGVNASGQEGVLEPDPRTLCLVIARPMPAEIQAKHPTLQVCITSSIASAFGYRQRAQSRITLVDPRERSASHVELVFRDQYLSRADMWRLVSSELASKTVYKGKKISFLSTIKATVKSIYIHGRAVSSAYFCETTVPIFRSESARYVLFLQMSKEMWEFDSEGGGEILFSRMVDGFLPQLFKKWMEMDARHLVSIVLFSRIEYDRQALTALKRLHSGGSEAQSTMNEEGTPYRDFYRVVVTDMASGQWTTILNKLKKVFRVFLRDITLYRPEHAGHDREQSGSGTDEADSFRICGRPVSAPRGNILEAINIASTQFANDHLDRDMVRTGLFIIVITPGTGVFEVDQRLLSLTSENLINNGIGIDLVCLSKMPLHSVPLFKWREKLPEHKPSATAKISPIMGSDFAKSREGPVSSQTGSPPLPEDSMFKPPPGGDRTPQRWSFGIPQWIHVSYWTWDSQQNTGSVRKGQTAATRFYRNAATSRDFVTRVRMYELQMMGAMELGLASISIPFLSEKQQDSPQIQKTKSEILEQQKTRAIVHAPRSALSRTVTSSRSSLSAYATARGRGLLSVQAKSQGHMLEKMETYDRTLFDLSPKPTMTSSKLTRSSKVKSNAMLAKISGRKSLRSQDCTDDGFGPASGIPNASSSFSGNLTDEISNMQARASGTKSKPVDSRISRSISYALRGLGPSTPRAIASTDINVENVQAEQAVSNVTSQYSLDSPKSRDSPAKPKLATLQSPPLVSAGSVRLNPSSRVQEKWVSPSRPILIKNLSRNISQSESGSPSSVTSSTEGSSSDKEKLSASHVQAEQIQNCNATENNGGRCPAANVEAEMLRPDMSLWIVKVNPANPKKKHFSVPIGVGRWQHLNPHQRKKSAVNWKSLSIPASVPLTTEHFPTQEELESQYIATDHVAYSTEDIENQETSRGRDWLLREMIALRLSHGYQLIVGRGVAQMNGSNVVPSIDLSAPGANTQDGQKIFMSMGNMIQRLLCINGTDVRVTRFVHKEIDRTEARLESFSHEPVIKTILSTSYRPRLISFEAFPKEYPWALADHHLSNPHDDLNKVYDQLRYWRARFVVIPVETPSAARRTTPSVSEDNDEEIHLLGIRELTKMWQKIRYVPATEGRFKSASAKLKDANPLNISFQTLDPSQIVATEIERLVATEEVAEAGQIELLPDSELLERSNLSLSKIGQLLQGENGVEIANRRWHFRLHSSCFKGDDLTNWLITRVKGIDSREEAVAFGNELMQHGLFSHVSTRHTFKDGNYFYTIAPEHRILRAESRSSWFAGGRRPDHSSPATPVVERGRPVSPSGAQSSGGWGSVTQADVGSSEKGSGDKRQASISLTKIMRVEVDHRSPKRSDRAEIVNIHYDRLHNPENCYHFELSWLNVTSKLIEDAIVSWATQLEKYGLRIVEVPIAEVCSISDREPFREPYRVAVRVTPPSAGDVVSKSASMYSPKPSLSPKTPSLPDRLVYQKALLKHFNFVLDLEAVSEFPSDVDVTYTWGQLGYRHTQFVHRSGVILAQITDEGEFLLLANRLFNTRSASTKDTSGRFEAPTSSRHRPATASGSVGLHAQHLSPHHSPLVRAASDVLVAKDAPPTPGISTNITPEQVKDELQEFCQDADRLKAFYKEVTERETSGGRKAESSSSSILRPVPELGLESSIPDLRLPASVISAATAAVKSFGSVRAKKDGSPKTAQEKGGTP